MKTTTKIAAVLAVFLAAVLPYISTLHDYFLADDYGVVQLLAQKPMFYFPRWFVSTWMDDIWGFTLDEIRPFTALSFQLTALWGAASPVASHVLNIGLHAVNALLVFVIALRIAGFSPPAAAFSGILFAVLPIQTETVVWITGRVDSIPTLFCLLSLLAYAFWRRGAAGWMYWISVAMCFAALFSKQTTIVLPAVLVLYDVLIEKRAVRFSWAWLRNYVPFALLTAGYLGLRYVLFNQVIREAALSAQALIGFGVLQARHLQKLIFGSVVFGGDATSPVFVNAAFAALIAALLLTSLLVLHRVWVQRREAPAGPFVDAGALLLFFGPVWWLAGTAPTAVAAYESARHLYFGSIGFAVVLGLGFDGLWRSRRRVVQYAAILAAAALILVYGVKLQAGVSEWSRAAYLSEKVTADIARLVAESPPGSLLIIDPATLPSPAANSPYPENLWAWAIPFALEPPFTARDLKQRAFIIAPAHIYCCDSQWFEYTRRNISRWSEQTDRPPVISLRWDSATGAMLQHSDRDSPLLREPFLKLVDVRTREELTEQFYALINQLRTL